LSTYCCTKGVNVFVTTQRIAHVSPLELAIKETICGHKYLLHLHIQGFL